MSPARLAAEPSTLTPAILPVVRSTRLHPATSDSAKNVGVAAQVLALVEAVLPIAIATFALLVSKVAIARTTTAFLTETTAVALPTFAKRVLVLTRTPQLITVASTSAAIAVVVLSRDRERRDEEDSRSGCSKETIAHQDALWRHVENRDAVIEYDP